MERVIPALEQRALDGLKSSEFLEGALSESIPQGGGGGLAFLMELREFAHMLPSLDPRFREIRIRIHQFPTLRDLEETTLLRNQLVQEGRPTRIVVEFDKMIEMLRRLFGQTIVFSVGWRFWPPEIRTLMHDYMTGATPHSVGVVADLIGRLNELFLTHLSGDHLDKELSRSQRDSVPNLRTHLLAHTGCFFGRPTLRESS
jgi:hypothetical protein